MHTSPYSTDGIKLFQMMKNKPFYQLTF